MAKIRIVLHVDCAVANLSQARQIQLIEAAIFVNEHAVLVVHKIFAAHNAQILQPQRSQHVAMHEQVAADLFDRVEKREVIIGVEFGPSRLIDHIRWHIVERIQIDYFQIAVYVSAVLVKSFQASVIVVART